MKRERLDMQACLRAGDKASAEEYRKELASRPPQPDRMEQRFERFAQLRAANPEVEYDEIMTRIHDEEVEADEAAEGRRILSEMDA